MLAKFIFWVFIIGFNGFGLIVGFSVKEKYGLNAAMLVVLVLIGFFFAVVLNPAINRWLGSLEKR